MKQHGEQQDAGETRRLILQAAQNLFMMYGYRAVTTRQVADACGITQPALYRHFSDKQDLYVSMIVDTTTQAGAVLERIARRDVSVEERLRLAAIYFLNNSKHDMTMMAHDMRYELSTDARTTLERIFFESVLRPLATIFDDGIRQGVLRSPEQEGVAGVKAVFLFLSIIPNFIAQSLDMTALEDQKTVTERARQIVEFTVHGLAAYDRQQNLHP